jgi:hypothetical protein
MDMHDLTHDHAANEMNSEDFARALVKRLEDKKQKTQMLALEVREPSVPKPSFVTLCNNIACFSCMCWWGVASCNNDEELRSCVL